MKLDLIDNFLQIKLNPLEIILAHRGSLSIPLDHVIHASAENRNGISLRYVLQEPIYHFY